jgi:hypothetical protein
MTTPQVIVTEDENVVEHLSSERADEALSKGIHVRRAYRRAHDAHARRPEYASEARTELHVVIADDNLWRAVHCGVPGLRARSRRPALRFAKRGARRAEQAHQRAGAAPVVQQLIYPTALALLAASWVIALMRRPQQGSAVDAGAH